MALIYHVYSAKMIKKRKVLIFLPANIGGAERVTVTIAQFLIEADYEVVFVVVTNHIGSIQHIIPKDKRIVIVRVRNIWDFTVTKISRIISHEKPDFLFSSLRYLNPRVLMASKLAGHAKVIVRNDNGLQTARWDNKILMRWTYPWAEKVVAQQEEMRQELIDQMKLNPQKVVAIHNPFNKGIIDQLAEEPSPYPQDSAVNVLHVGRFFHNKGQDTACKAFQQLHQRLPQAHLYFVGKFDENDAYFQMVREFVVTNGMEGFVHFVGHDPNPYKWMKHCDCLVMPSRYEGTPNVLIEAMYLRKPVVATKCIPIIEQMVRDGHNGLLVETDDIEAIASAMEKALQLTDFGMTYQPGEKEDFLALFQTES